MASIVATGVVSAAAGKAQVPVSKAVLLGRLVSVVDVYIFTSVSSITALPPSIRREWVS